MGAISLVAPLLAPRLLRPVTPGRGRYWYGAVVGAAVGAAAITTAGDLVARRACRRPRLHVVAPEGGLGGRAATTVLGGTAIATTWQSRHRRSTACGKDGAGRRTDSEPGPGWRRRSGWDFIYYWNHRLMHESRYMWAIHVVHHSSERYNLSTALRQPVLDAFGTPSPTARWPVRDPARQVNLARGINLLYQYWIHTEAISRLGRPRGAQHPVAPPGPPRLEPAVHRPQSRQHPDPLGPAVRHLRARERARRLRADQEHRHLQRRPHRHPRVRLDPRGRGALDRRGATGCPSWRAARAGPTGAAGRWLAACCMAEPRRGWPPLRKSCSPARALR